MNMSPVIAIHLSAALSATAIGPLALWARQGRTQRPRLHRALGYAWVTLMLMTAVSAIFIRDHKLPNIAGYTPIHLLIPTVFGVLALSFWFLARGNISGHRKTMQRLYIGSCLVAGAFTLLPSRYLGQRVWGEWLGLLSSSATPAAQTQIGQILTGTPVWVWVLLAVLLVLGLALTRTRRASLVRVATVPLLMSALSLYGTVAAFGASALVLGCWLAAAALTLTIVMRSPVPAGAVYDAGRREFLVPGSWVPLVLIMGIFLTKYAVNVSLAIQPGLETLPALAVPVATLYGVFSGAFAGRTARLLRLARPARGHTAPGTLALSTQS